MYKLNTHWSLVWPMWLDISRSCIAWPDTKWGPWKAKKLLGWYSIISRSEKKWSLEDLFIAKRNAKIRQHSTKLTVLQVHLFLFSFLTFISLGINICYIVTNKWINRFEENISSASAYDRRPCPPDGKFNLACIIGVNRWCQDFPSIYKCHMFK